MEPPNSSSQCFQKGQCFWLQSIDCRLGQYIPDPMASCTMGNKTWVARKSALLTVYRCCTSCGVAVLTRESMRTSPLAPGVICR